MFWRVIFSASAAWYHVSAASALPPLAGGMFEKYHSAFAAPSTADVELHGNGVKNAMTRMGCVLCSVPPHFWAAAWNTLSACWPTVVPGLPPTGAAGVGSLKPSPAGSPLTTMICAAHA